MQFDCDTDVQAYLSVAPVYAHDNSLEAEAADRAKHVTLEVFLISGAALPSFDVSRSCQGLDVKAKVNALLPKGSHAQSLLTFDGVVLEDSQAVETLDTHSLNAVIGEVSGTYQVTWRDGLDIWQRHDYTSATIGYVHFGAAFEICDLNEDDQGNTYGRIRCAKGGWILVCNADGDETVRKMRA
jgi:hypothetical protein